ncbi:hypothetical protein B0T19DRAFT_401332 [Cercophora scortea]|uniref:Uncharacterized protein n=1 Tax=Cercophora scortea TaxID=314031 RepID=A0AAE0INQ5_9PEZI|nr:hypothetical protein B0T19DRAFT_401332 [Cercophora scortea]
MAKCERGRVFGGPFGSFMATSCITSLDDPQRFHETFEPWQGFKFLSGSRTPTNPLVFKVQRQYPSANEALAAAEPALKAAERDAGETHDGILQSAREAVEKAREKVDFAEARGQKVVDFWYYCEQYHEILQLSLPRQEALVRWAISHIKHGDEDGQA